MSRRRIRARRFWAVGAAAVLAVTALAGCTQSTPLNTQPTYNTDGVSEWKTAQSPVVFSGPTATGATFDSKTYDGHVMVVNFFYAGCPPCRVEAPMLQKLSREYADKGVQFVGIDTRDQAGTALPFLKAKGVTYPTILDVGSGSVQQVFSAKIVPSEVPTTFVLSASHGTRARIIGQISDASTLSSLIDDALATS